MMYKPNTVSGVFEVKASAEFYDDEATVETLRYIIEQDLEDAGLDVDVKVLRKQMPLMTDREKMIHELTYQINSNEVMRQHYPVQLPVTDARKVLELLKERTGRWVEEPDRVRHWHCSECGFVEGVVCGMENYCPNCGAKMEKPDMKKAFAPEVDDHA